MRQLSYWSRTIFNTAHMVDPERAEVIAGVLLRARTRKGAELKAEAEAWGGESERGPNDFYMLPNGIGVIPVMGELVHRHDWMTAMSGLTSYNKISDQLVAAMRDDSVEEILLHIDSPGGMVKGCFDLVSQIRDAREKKRITAFADGNMTSAAYAIGAAANHCIASETANVGSIGVLMMHVDRSAFLKEQGIKVTYIKSGKDKDLGAPDKELDDEDRKKLQAHVDDVASIFFTHVNQSRSNLSVETIRGLEAGVFLGQQALDIGLIDEINSFQETLATMTGQPYGSWKRTGHTAVMQAAQPEGEDEMLDEHRKQLAGQLGLHASAGVDEIIEKIKSNHAERESGATFRTNLLGALDLGADASEEDAMEKVAGLKQLAVSQEDHDALQTELQDLKAEVLVDKAIKEDGKIMPAERDAWLTDAKADYDGTAAKIEARKRVIPKGSLPDGPDATTQPNGAEARQNNHQRAVAYMHEQMAAGRKINLFQATVEVVRGGKGAQA